MATIRNTAVLSLTAAIAVLLAGPTAAQQQPPGDLWRTAPPNAILIAGWDARPESASMKAIAEAQSPETQALLAKQQVAIRRAIENFALLFGVSMNFAKDIDSWAAPQSLFMLLPDTDKGPQPVLVMASRDAVSAEAALLKALAPWQRIGELKSEQDGEYTISSFTMKDQGIEVYASAAGPVVAFSQSKDVLKQALKGRETGSECPYTRALSNLSGSMFYAYLDAALLDQFGQGMDMVPLSNLGLGVSLAGTGLKMRLVGFPTEQGTLMFKQMFPADQPAAIMGPGIPATSLVGASLPSLGSLPLVAGLLSAPTSPVLAVLKEVGDLRISGAVTAALPLPAWLVSAAAESDQAATEKLTKIIEGLRKARATVTDGGPVAGANTWKVVVKGGPTAYLAQSGRHLFVASDTQSVGSGLDTINSRQPKLAESETYKETTTALGDSNILTLYANLAPVQGLGYLAEGLGLADWPFYGEAARSLQNVYSLGLGAGFDGEALSATLFLRAKPTIEGPSIGPALVGGAAIGSAILFPVFARARDAAQNANCTHNLNQLVMAAQCYATDHGGKLPTMNDWQSEIAEYLIDPLPKLKCRTGNSVYAFNKNLGGINFNKLTNQQSVVMFFEAAPDLRNRTGSRANAILAHRGEGFFAFADGRVERLSEAPPQPQWVPAYASPKPVQKAPVNKTPAPVKRKK